ncbi:hypothetical protein Cni_G26334 [Canna indica]|uniref:DUF4408 domain-containing protein n=1 Tax=Canna indica TaxID=4628 RepID=A0AAQ3QLX4_9LILI|nr:hypothetical protein Cni_G26334 [Canna indica]
MEKLPTSQVAKAVFLLILLLFIPFISPSFRPSYLYLLLNILIIALGLEAGFLKAISKPHDSKKTPSTAPAAGASLLPATAVTDNNATNNKNKFINAVEAVPDNATTNKSMFIIDYPHQGIPPAARSTPRPVVKKFNAPRLRSLKRCDSKPSIFFIGGGSDGESGVRRDHEEKYWEEGGDLSKQELFTKAEAFIGSFYMQLRMQREESWKKIHGFYL